MQQVHKPDPSQPFTALECPICIETIDQPTDWLQFGCKHGTCSACFHTLAFRAQAMTCPLCRMRLLPLAQVRGQGVTNVK